MWRRILTVVLILVQVGCLAQNADEMEAILRISGADSPEDMDAYEVERLSDFLTRPLRINSASSTELNASGLMSKYQVASLVDYRTRHSDIMSLMELAAVDGFDEEFVRRLAPFITLVSDAASSFHGCRSEIAVRGAVRNTVGQTDWNAGLKYRCQTGRFMLTLAANRAYGASDFYPSAYSGSFTYYFKRIGGKVLLGDFNARFGQGLTLWNGAFITSLNTPEAFMRKPSGLSQSWSYTSSSALTGAAAEVAVKSFTFTALLAAPGLKAATVHPDKVRLMPAVNVTWQGRNGSVGMTHMAEFLGEPGARSSLDCAFCIRGVNLYSEAAYDWMRRHLNILAGTGFKVGESMQMALLGRYLSGDLYEFAFSGSFGSTVRRHVFTFAADAIYYPESKDESVLHSFQVKSNADWIYYISPTIQLHLKVSERFRTWGRRFRTDLRGDFTFDNGSFVSTLRMNVLHCKELALLSYIEAGYRKEGFSVYGRCSVFKVDDWEDRIYVYERDAPGSFNVPAMYGRGWSASIVSSYKLNMYLRFYLRASYCGYQFMPQEKRKPGKAELKFQLICRF